MKLLANLYLEMNIKFPLRSKIIFDYSCFLNTDTNDNLFKQIFKKKN